MVITMWVLMWCMGLLALVPVSYGSLADQMAETTQICCNQGINYGRNHTSEDCSSSIPPDVPPTFGSLCIFAMDQCCKEYFDKKRDCESGVEIATNLNNCLNTKNTTKKCCDQCSRGTAAGSARGAEACTQTIRGNSAEQLLAGDTFMQCCKTAANKANKRKEPTVRPDSSLTVSKKPPETQPYSLCEDFAPNELCAHHCIPVPGSYRCECNPGFKLMADKRNCMEITKNRCKPHNPCQHKCNDNGVEVKCSCRRGYQLMADGKSCEDIDECLMEPPMCLPNTQCHNVQGSYKCIPLRNPVATAEKGHCPPGFSRNLENNVCDDVNECKLPKPPCPHYLCENTIGGYKCGGVPGDPTNLVNKSPPVEDRCPPGFKSGINEECEDIDECAVNKDDCNKMSQFCINTRGSFYCQDQVSKHCPPGFKTNSVTNKCEDINECDDGENICRPDQVCVNVPGEYDCRAKPSKPGMPKNSRCPDGMREEELGSGVCKDIDECAEGTHLCDQYQNCQNTNGSHECHCKIGFQQDPTTGACVDINECATDQNNCIAESQRCDNTVGSYLCIRFISCGTGYILHYSTSTCEDVDECALGTHNCDRAGPDYHCVNIPGSFRCQKKSTPAPEYEYEYYDSEEEIDENKTIAQTTAKAETGMTSSSTSQVTTVTEVTIPITKPTEATPKIDRVPEEIPMPFPDEIDNNITPYNRPEPAFPKTDRNLTPTRQNAPDSINSIQILEPTPPYYQHKSDLYPYVTETTFSPLTEVNTAASPKEEKETATVRDGNNRDKSVFVNVQSQPDNTWTKFTEKPACEVGFELGSFGECIDIDECATNRHVCSVTTEVCRNKMGGYVCDCAPGFRRDLHTGLCSYTVRSSSSTSTSTSSSTKTTTSSTPALTSKSTSPTTPTPTTPPTTPRISPAPTTPSTISTTILPTTPPTTPSPTTPPTTPSSTTPSSTTPPTLPPTTPSYTTPPTTPVPSTMSTRRNFYWDGIFNRKIPTRTFRPRTSCDAGFYRNIKTGQCDDVNECLNGQANCAAVEICVNTDGGYRCDCPPDWQLSPTGQRCVPVFNNRRFPSGYENERPYQPIDSYNRSPKGQIDEGAVIPPDVPEDHDTTASCQWGYRLGMDNTCEDIDECATGVAKCGPMQHCTNLQGGYTCSCPSGYRLVGDHLCEDVDECSTNDGVPACSHNADCVNTIGSYQCRCHKGFKSAPINDKVCVDVDECSESRQGALCQQRCNNMWGGYRCSCHRGYRLNPDNSTCSDIDECSSMQRAKLCNGRCVNEPGSYRCTCPAGYRLSLDNKSCIDIDECETGEATCSKGSKYGDTSEVCLNTRGGYRCQRITCPSGYHLESRHRCTKIETVCSPSDWECAHQPTTISYNFITFVSNLAIPESQPVKLFTMVGPTWPYAKIFFQLKLVEVNAPPHVAKADFSVFSLQQINNQAVTSLLQPLEGPQSIELEMSMELYNKEIFGGIAVARLYIYVSEYEF